MIATATAFTVAIEHCDMKFSLSRWCSWHTTQKAYIHLTVCCVLSSNGWANTNVNTGTTKQDKHSMYTGMHHSFIVVSYPSKRLKATSRVTVYTSYFLPALLCLQGREGAWTIATIGSWAAITNLAQLRHHVHLQTAIERTLDQQCSTTFTCRQKPTRCEVLTAQGWTCLGSNLPGRTANVIVNVCSIYCRLSDFHGSRLILPKKSFCPSRTADAIIAVCRTQRRI